MQSRAYDIQGLIGRSEPLTTEELREMPTTTEPFESVLLLYRLKEVKRQGWLLRGVPYDKCESVAAHSLHTTQAGFMVKGSKELIDMLMVHDWAEALAGDPTPHCKMDPKEKHEREYHAMRIITAGAPDGKHYMQLWEEWEERKTPRAILAKQLDYLDACVKALYYENMGYDTSEFYPYTREKLTEPALIRVYDNLMKRVHPLEKSHLACFVNLAAEKENIMPINKR